MDWRIGYGLADWWWIETWLADCVQIGIGSVMDFGAGPGLVDCQWMDELLRNWQLIVGLVVDRWYVFGMDWRIELWLALDWWQIGRRLVVGIVLRRDTSSGLHSTLVPRYSTGCPPIDLRLAWSVPMRCRLVTVRFFVVWDWSEVGIGGMDWSKIIIGRLVEDWHWIDGLVIDWWIRQRLALDF